MLGDVLSNLLSWSLVVGIAIGFALSKALAVARVCWADKHEPLPDGRRRSRLAALRIDRRWLIGFIAVTFLSWSVYTTNENDQANERNAADAAAFALRVQDCQKQLIEAINASRAVTAANEKLSADNDRLSKEERRLLAELGKAQSEWLGQLIAPTDPRIAALDPNDPVREEYGFAVSRTFFAKAGDINRRIDAIHDEQAANDAARPKTRPALPEPNCGK
ncbi:hypothetical protein KDW77_gp32 [Mycobacterium phage Pinnie]|uniref:Uncharacterized protein n=1 Tax=Mycobacterium phage Pinnie TaxID=2517965 RepID=A0A482JF53_9CAUD|nr:hypothetical protein KDW77_gp32 [Mycobacterium phage Pinnie]QBP30246.1 hypothetical protein SEA_PINNIE_32 [Mycobacterium phage Pinnie]